MQGQRGATSPSPNHVNRSDGTIMVHAISELTNFIIQSNRVLPHLTLRLSVFTRVVANRFLHVSPFHRTAWFSFRAVQRRNVRNAAKEMICVLRIRVKARNSVMKIQSSHPSHTPRPSDTSSSKATHGYPDPMHLPSCLRHTLRRRSRPSMARTVDGFCSR